MSYFVLKYRGFYVAKRNSLLLTKDRNYAAKFKEDEYNDAFTCWWEFDKPGMVIRKVCCFGLIEWTIRGWRPPRAVLEASAKDILKNTNKKKGEDKE